MTNSHAVLFSACALLAITGVGCGSGPSHASAPPAQTPSADTAATGDDLIRRGAADQRVRSLDPSAMTEMQQIAWADDISRVDEGNTAWLKDLIDRQGWPDRPRFGDDASTAAFLIVQHADADPQFQAHCLPLLEAAVQRGEVKPSRLAYLTDRVRVKQGRPQLYGTQYNALHGRDGLVMGDNDEPIYEIPLVEDAANLDARRAAAGLGPWIEYERRMAQQQKRLAVESPRDGR